MSLIRITENDVIPLALQLEDGDVGKFPQAIVRDDGGNELGGSPYDLTHKGDGFYSSTSLVMTSDPFISAVYIVYNEIGHTTESVSHLRSNDIFLLNTSIVWDEVVADHQGDGTYGGEVATKADIQAATSTLEVVADSGTAVQGTVISGTYVSTAVRDNTYWQIQEDASNGITVEFIFTMSDPDCKPGVFEVFGRYEGVPSKSHYQELWAWNVESAAWEQLIEIFMPGGITSDATFQHEYYERHINRPTQEVKIRVIHNITSYNGTHNIYFDSVRLSCIIVITAADIADAVWEEAAADHEIAGTTGAKLRLMEQILRNKIVTDPVTGIMTLYDDAGGVLLTAQLYEETGTGQAYRGQGAERRERLEEP
ncbi:hypothetical protein LCGC14_0678740 [marine sediment metagenome]|uniref:Uncharacterized protein n=1 Tax=marine sediment metagenome TaxID=412755 RepID=A0A0F9QTZ1_9ZZZZ